MEIDGTHGTRIRKHITGKRLTESRTWDTAKLHGTPNFEPKIQ